MADGDFNILGMSIPELLAGLYSGYQAYQGTSDAVTKPYMMPGQEAGYGTAIDAAMQDFSLGPDTPGYKQIAGMDPNVIAGQNANLGALGQLGQLGQQGGQTALTLAQGGVAPVEGFQLEDQIGFGIPQEYQDAIMNPIMRNLTDKVIPGLHQAATANGAFGGTRMQQQKADAAAQATQAATDAMIQGNLQARQQSIGQRAGDISALLSGRNQDIQQGQIANNAMATGMDALTAAGNLALAPGNVQTDIGTDRMEYEQKINDALAYNQNLANTNQDNWINQLFNRLSGGNFGGSIQQGQPGGWGDAAFGFLSGSNIYNNSVGGGATQPTAQTNQQAPNSN